MVVVGIVGAPRLPSPYYPRRRSSSFVARRFHFLLFVVVGRRCRRLSLVAVIAGVVALHGVVV